MDIKGYLKQKADTNDDGKIDVSDLNFAIDAVKADKHLVALYAFAVGVVFTLVIVRIFGF